MNRSSSIETFIREHRHAFDAATPGAHHWQGLEKVLDRLPTADGLETALLHNRILLDTEMPSGKVWQEIEQFLDGYVHTTPDPLEQFIRENREALDSEVPDLKVWANVTRNIPSSKTVVVHMNWRHSLLRIAASIALLLAGVTAGIWYARLDEAPAMAMSDVSNEYAELETYYQRDIAGKQQKLASFTGSQPAEVHEDMEQLDGVMTELQKELAGVPAGNREQVVRAMIENYKAKAAILERVLDRLEPTKTDAKNSEQNNVIKNI